MIGHQQIIDLRKSGKKPALVFLMTSGRPRKVGDVLLTPVDTSPDLRFLIGLDVVLIASQMTSQVRSLWYRLKESKPAFAVLALTDLNDAIKWKPGHRDIKIGEDWDG